jgi:hypothetical protein
MHDVRFVALEAGALSAFGGHGTFDDAAVQAAHGATRNGTPHVIVRVVGEVRVVKEVKVERFDGEATHVDA